MGHWLSRDCSARGLAVFPSSRLPVSSRRVASTRQRGRGAMRVQAIDAAQPFDFEFKAKNQQQAQRQLKIGVLGFGNFGQFLAERFVARGHRVLATSRSDYHAIARKLNVEFFQDPNDFCEEHPDVVVLATSILSAERVLSTLPIQRLKRSTLFVDVLSVKVFPKQLLLSVLPPEVDILCTHPMFGPDSGKASWQGLNFMYERVRIGTQDARRVQRCETLLSFFREEGCRMVEITCEEHDRQAASTQFVTHTVGRMLGAMELQSTDINTRGFESLLDLVNNTANDSFELYYGLFLYNQNATEELERLEQGFEQVKKQLFGRLHDIARAQIFPSHMSPVPNPPASPIRASNQIAATSNGSSFDKSHSSASAAMTSTSTSSASESRPDSEHVRL